MPLTTIKKLPYPPTDGSTAPDVAGDTAALANAMNVWATGAIAGKYASYRYTRSSLTINASVVTTLLFGTLYDLDIKPSTKLAKLTFDYSILNRSATSCINEATWRKTLTDNTGADVAAFNDNGIARGTVTGFPASSAEVWFRHVSWIINPPTVVASDAGFVDLLVQITSGTGAATTLQNVNANLELFR
jgi:hypothetical protein